MVRRLACSAALTIGLAVMAPAAFACDGSGCQSAVKAKSAKPLQLGKFMRPAGAKSAAAKSAAQVAKAPKAAHKHAALGRRIRHAAPAPAAPQPLAADVASAFASQPAPDVRVVENDEVNEIDLAAGPALPETDGRGQRVENAVQVVEATDYNDVDRKIGDPAPLTGSIDEPAQTAKASLTWIERFWAGVQNTLVVLTAGWRYLFG